MDAVKFANWYTYGEALIHSAPTQGDRYTVAFASFEELAAGGEKGAQNELLIPVGSVEFAEMLLKRQYGVEYIKPLLVPPAITTARKTDIVTGPNGVTDFMSQNQLDTAFVKSASRVKGEEGVHILSPEQVQDELREGESYFVSEVMDIVSEWRVFVKRGRVVDVRNYSGDPWVVPDKDKVYRMMQEFQGTCPSSYTLDVAVVPPSGDGKYQTEVVEVRNFISCGLYGFSSPFDLLTMLEDGIRWETRASIRP